jgi:hypothetical protein
MIKGIVLFAAFTVAAANTNGKWVAVNETSVNYMTNGHHCGTVIKGVSPEVDKDGTQHVDWYGYTYTVSGASKGIRVHSQDANVVKAQVEADCSAVPQYVDYSN